MLSKKTTKYIIIGVIVLMLLLGVTFIAVGNPLDKVKSDCPVDKSMFPLKRGDRNCLVAKLQQKLGILDDGIFGPDTEGAVKAKIGTATVTIEQFKKL